MQLHLARALRTAAAALAFSAAGFPGLAGQAAGQAAATVVGMVFDSTVASPLADARVAVLGTNATAESDEQGQFRIDGIPAGAHTVVFYHERLGELGVSPMPLQVVLAPGSVSEAYLHVPSRETLLAGWCSIEPGEGDVSVGGVVTDSLTGVPLPRAQVTALGAPFGLLHRRPVLGRVRTEASGEFRICNVQADEVVLTVLFGSSRSELLDIPNAGPSIVDVSLHIADPVTITGSVTDHATGGPIEDARVQLVGTAFAEFTDSAGRFGFAGVPPGMQLISTEVLGYAPRVDSLTVFSNEALGLEIELATEAIALDPIVVTGRRRDVVFTTPGTRFSGLNAAQVDSIIPRVVDLAGLMRAARMPGLIISERYMANVFGQTQLGICIEMQRARNTEPNACNMVEVRVNDGPVPDASFFLLDFNPQDVRSLQFITPIEAGLLYGDRGVNGVLLIYTR